MPGLTDGRTTSEFQLMDDWRKSKFGWVCLAVVVLLNTLPAFIETIPLDMAGAATWATGALGVVAMVARGLNALGFLKSRTELKKAVIDAEVKVKNTVPE